MNPTTKKPAFDIRTNPMSAGDLICLLKGMISRGTITNETKVVLSVDEEGNAYAPLILDGIILEQDSKSKNVLTIYPINPQQL